MGGLVPINAHAAWNPGLTLNHQDADRGIRGEIPGSGEMTALLETAPPPETLVAAPTHVVSQKFIEEQPPVLWLILAPNHPSDEDLSPGTPVRAKIRAG
jgi:hypothetical protein